MIYLVLAVISSALISILMRLGGEKTEGKLSMLAVNYLVCLALAAVFTLPGQNGFHGEGVGTALGLGAINGALYLLGFVLLQVNVRKNGVVLSSAFMKLGLLVPMAVSVCFFHEIPEWEQIVGFCLTVVAILVINFEKQRSAGSFKAGLILLLLAGGGADAMAKVYEEVGNGSMNELFLLCTFGIAFLLCVGLMIGRGERPGKKELLFGALIGIPNYFSARFLLLALEQIKAVIVYPTYSVATIVVVSVAGVCFFRERLGKRHWLGMGMILAALILLNL